MKKEILLAFLVLLILINILQISFISWMYANDYRLTGKTGNLGFISISIEENRRIDILSPENITYNFSYGENYTLNLNVSSIKFAADSWWYTLIDKRHNLVVSQDVIFTPNTTFNAVQFDNEIIVYANDSVGNIVNESVEFFILIPNSAPQIHYTDPEIYVCENDYLSYFFNVTDIDEEVPSASISPTAPTSPFYVTFSRTYNETLKIYEIFSGTILKSHLGSSNIGNRTFQENISVNDGQYADSKITNITMIEMNNPPYVEPIGVQTLGISGENSTFVHNLSGSDSEDGIISSGNLTFQLTILNSSDDNYSLFNINSTGFINFTANESCIGTYRIWISVVDNGLKNYHPNITNYCNESPYNKSTVINFTLTVSDENRPPYITSFYPNNTNNSNLTIYEGTRIYFNVTMRDPDLTPVDAYWYYDETLVKYEPGFDNGNFSSLNYLFDYNSAGNRTIRVNVTDGNLSYSYDSVHWNITVIDAEPPIGSSEGGGGGGMPICIEKWGCSQWNECKNAKESLGFFLLTEQEYLNITRECKINFWESDESCGFQIRKCEDVHYCNSTNYKPSEMQACHYTEKPNCEDGIKNCHDGGCEILIDCGGPCKECPTCSDEIQNQGEEGIDCGGPCRPCKIEKPFPMGNLLRYVLIFSTVSLSIIAIILSLKYLKLISLFRREKKHYPINKTAKKTESFK